MYAPFPTRSSRPTAATAGSNCAAIRTGRRATTTTSATSKASTALITASWPRNAPSASRSANTLNNPSPTPASTPNSSPEPPPDPSSATRDTSTTARIASPIPASTIADGAPSRTMPTTTGIVAASTPVTGATTLIRPTASPWYSDRIPTPAAIPESAAQPRSTGAGSGSPRIRESSAVSRHGTARLTSTTPNSGARRLRSPPPKSAVPQAAAESSPSTTVAMPGPSTSAVGGRPRRLGRLGCAAVHGRRPTQLDDLVGDAVVAVGRGQVDHLEVVGDLAQELQCAGGAGIVE